MNTFEILNKSLWITSIIFVFFWLGRYAYLKVKRQSVTYFYLVKVKKNKGEWVFLVHAPKSDFSITISVQTGSIPLIKKEIVLNQGNNRIRLINPDLSPELEATATLWTADQKIERNL